MHSRTYGFQEVTTSFNQSVEKIYLIFLLRFGGKKKKKNLISLESKRFIHPSKLSLCHEVTKKLWNLSETLKEYTHIANSYLRFKIFPLPD